MYMYIVWIYEMNVRVMKDAISDCWFKLVLSRVSEYSYASLLHCQNEYTLLHSINGKHKKKSIKHLCLWYSVFNALLSN